VLLTDKAQQLGLNRLLPCTDGKYRIYLGGQIWGDPPPKYKSGTITDNFNRTEDLGDSADWTETDGDIDCDGAQALAQTASSINNAKNTNDIGSADHYTQADLTVCDTSCVTKVGVRFNGSAWGSGAQVYYAGAGDAANTFSINKRDGGSSSTLTSKAYTWSLPDTVKIQISGNALTGYVNGSEELSTTDNDITTTQYGGLIGYMPSGAADLLVGTIMSLIL